MIDQDQAMTLFKQAVTLSTKWTIYVIS
jgi:hypothetical protein